MKKISSLIILIVRLLDEELLVLVYLSRSLEVEILYRKNDFERSKILLDTNLKIIFCWIIKIILLEV